MREIREWLVSRPIRGRTTGSVMARTRVEALRIANSDAFEPVEACDFDVEPCGKWVVDCEAKPFCDKVGE
jgi:hypothetical protein